MASIAACAAVSMILFILSSMGMVWAEPVAVGGDFWW